MVVFIDESGVHATVGYSAIAIIFVRENLCELFEQEVVAIERSLRISSFHWARHSWRIKTAFLKNIASLQFSATVIMVRNPFLPDRYFSERLSRFMRAQPIRTLVIDGEKSRYYRMAMKKTLRDTRVSVKKLRIVRDESSAGIRIADAIAGLVRVYCEDPTKKVNLLFQLLSKKITVLSDGQDTS